MCAKLFFLCGDVFCTLQVTAVTPLSYKHLMERY